MRNAPTSPLTRPLAGAVLLALALAACSSGPRQAGSGDTASPAHGQPAADSLTAEVHAPAPSPVPTRAESERGSAAADASRQRQQRMAAAVAAQKQYMAVAAPAAAIAPLPAPVVTERYQGRDDNPVQRAGVTCFASHLPPEIPRPAPRGVHRAAVGRSSDSWTWGEE